MKNNVLFATGNSRKIAEAQVALAKFDITVDAIAVDIDEIQHLDPEKITKAKAMAAYGVTQKPVVVSDTSWDIPALGGFPGGYMKDVSAWFQPQDWLDLMQGYDDRRIFCLEHIAYYDGENMQHFVEAYEGTIIHEQRGRDDESESIEKVVILYGGTTLAEQLATGGIASAGEEILHWKQFGEWYSKNR